MVLMAATAADADVTRQIEAGDGLRMLLQQTLAAGAQSVAIPPGVYRFRANLDLSGLEGVAIDGQGAEFVFAGGMVRLMNCRHTVIRNLFLDVDPLPFVQGTVSALDPTGHTVDLRLDAGYPASAACAGKEGLRCVFFDPAGERELEIIDTTTPPPVEIAPGVLRIRSRRIFDVKHRPLAPGDRVVLSLKTGVGGISLTDCENVTLEDVTIYAAGRFAITESGFAAGGNTYRRCRVIRRPGSGRLMAGASDGFHSITQKKGPHLVACEIAHCFDDLVNIHGFFSLAVERMDNGAWLIAGPLGQDFAVGSRLRFYRAPDAEPLGEARVVACERREAPTREEIEQRAGEHFKRVCGRALRSLPQAQPCVVTLDREIDLAPFDFVSCADFAGAGAVIEDCHFHDGHVRGVLTKSSDSVIRRCRFERLARSGVVVAPEIYWLEGPFPENLRIEDNTFVDCGFGAVSPVEKSWEFAPLQVVSSFSRRLFPPLFSQTMNMRRIQCLGNRVERAPGPGILIMNAAEVELSGNTIIEPGARLAEAPDTLDLTRNLPPDAVLTEAEREAMGHPAFGILLAGVRSVTGTGNRVEGGRGLLGIGWNTEDVRLAQAPAPPAGTGAALVNSSGLTPVPIAAGTFTMGQDGPPCRVGAYYFGMWSPGAFQVIKGFPFKRPDFYRRAETEIQPVYADDGKRITGYVPPGRIPKEDWWMGVRDLWDKARCWPADPADVSEAYLALRKGDFSHLQPVIGYYDLTEPETIRKHIAQAHAFGLEFFNFYWYWNSFTRKEEFNTGLEQFLDVAGNPMKFAISICQHGGPFVLWGNEESVARRGKGPSCFEVAIGRLVRYVKRENYLRTADGRPIIYLLDPKGIVNEKTDAEGKVVGTYEPQGNTIEGFVGMLRSEVLEATGRAPLVVFGATDQTYAHRKPDGGMGTISALAFADAVTRLAPHRGNGKLREDQQEFGLPVMPGFTQNFDERPRFGCMKSPPCLYDPTDSFRRNFGQDLALLKAWMDEQPLEESRILSIYAWNEWHEGGIIEPNVRDGSRWLHAINVVFGLPRHPCDQSLIEKR